MSYRCRKCGRYIGLYLWWKHDNLCLLCQPAEEEQP